MRIALDASYSLDSAPSGVAIYCASLIAALVRSAPRDHFDLCYRANRFLRAFGASPPGSNCSHKLLEEFNCYLFRGRVDLFHGLNQRLPRCRFRRAIATFHDLFVIHGDYSTPEFRSRFTALAREAAGRADRIIAVSRYTADQVADHLGFPPSRIHVVHHGVNAIPQVAEDALATFRKEAELHAPFLLHVGAIQKRKNVVRVIEAFERLRPHYLLVLAGSAGYGAERIMARIESSRARDRVRVIGYVDGDSLTKLYRAAEALVFPSLEEGFGLPVLEAMSAGLPVVTSNRSAMPEVAGDAARLVDPDDTDSIEAGLVEVLEDEDRRAELHAKGLARATQFHWTKAANETLQVYAKAMQE